MAQTTLRDYLQEIEDALSSKRTEDALAKCQRTLEYFPESLEAQRLLGEVQLAQGQLEEAQHAFDWVLTNDPENVIAYCNRALISERLSDYDTALDCYQQAYELSRGNSQIREEFNALSSKAGQQGFMFSRAGLARLYMRGDLLSQAVQEWEIVLSTMPDRLDARVGLLETYWRGGSYDRVDELAKQILNDVPGCVKALLLQAYVTSAKNMLEAQDIMRRAEALDPDLLMAQELFSDLIASQPTNPFLKLIKKAPASLELANGKTHSAPGTHYLPESPQRQEGPLNSNLSAELLDDWNHLDDWNGIDTLKPQPTQAPQQSPSFSSWSGDHTPDLAAWKAPDPQPQASTNPASAPNIDTWETLDQASQQQPPFQMDAWQLPQSGSAPQPSPSIADQPTFEHQPWPGAEGSDIGDVESWSSFSSFQGTDANSTWSSGASPKKEEIPAPPAWLNMLTQSEQSAAPPEQRIAQQQQSPVVERPQPVAPALPPAALPEPDPLPLWDIEPALSSFSPNAEESFSFGPEWLKSLGATTMEGETPAKPEPVVAPAPPAPALAEPQPAPVALNASAANNQPAENLLTTLENLEHDLRTQGFVTHEPKSLAAIAQSQPLPEVPVTPEVVAPEPIAQQDEISYDLSDLTSALAQHRAALSSALEQLGNYNQQEAPPAEELPAPPAWSTPAEEYPTQPAWSTPAEEYPTPPAWSAPAEKYPAQPAWSAPLEEPSTPQYDAPMVEPEWMAALRAVPTPPAQERPASYPPASTPLEPAARVEAYPGPVYYPTPMPSPDPVPMPVASVEPVAMPEAARVPVPQLVPHIEESSDDELEMTMKRPALRLPAISQSNEAPEAVSSKRPNVSRAADSNLSLRERLLKGYQHQLVGDYDEAMQEYRIIIRTAPDMLAEVISNVRALLKLAPKYSAGYRVLGDAYMRQGEYLQAMEAYNKALTMAKKAKA